MRVEARSWASLYVERPLRFKPPFVAPTSQAEAMHYWWAQLQAVFPIEDPRLFPPLSVEVPERERDVLERFVLKARQVAESTALNYSSEMRVEISDNGMNEHVTSRFPPADVLAGLPLSSGSSTRPMNRLRSRPSPAS